MSNFDPYDCYEHETTWNSCAQCYEKEIRELKDQVNNLFVALDQIRDPRKRHKEPDSYTELACVMNIADEALKKLDKGIHV